MAGAAGGGERDPMAVPVPADGDAPVQQPLYRGVWSNTTHERTPEGIDAALNTWAPIVERELVTINGKIRQADTNIEDAGTRMDAITQRLVGLEARTGAVVAAGADRVEQVVQGVLQSAEYTRRVEASAGQAFETMKASLESIVTEAKAEFGRITLQQSESDKVIRDRTELLGRVAESLGQELERRCGEQEEMLKKVINEVKDEFRRREQGASSSNTGPMTGLGASAGPDPWQRAIDQRNSIPQGSTPQPQQQWQDQGRVDGMVNPRMWRADPQYAKNINKLDESAQSDPARYKVWQGQLTRWLSSGRKEVRDVLDWASKQTGTIDQVKEQEVEAVMSQYGGAAKVSRDIYDAIFMTMGDTMQLSMERTVQYDQGLELWRTIYHDHDSKQAPVIQAMFSKYVSPPARSKDIDELKVMLRGWENTGKELEALGKHIDTDLKNAALHKMVPADMSEAFKLPTLRGFEARLEYAKNEINLHNGEIAAKSEEKVIGKATGAVPMEINCVQKLRTVWNLTQEDHQQGQVDDGRLVRMYEAWNLTQGGGSMNDESLKQFMYALQTHGRKGGKAGGKGGRGGKGTFFDGECHHCGKYGHRLNQCRAKDAEMKEGKGGKGGKKGGGGKGVYGGRKGLNSLDEDKGQGEGDGGAGHEAAQPAEEEWPEHPPWMLAHLGKTVKPMCMPCGTGVEISKGMFGDLAVGNEEEEEEEEVNQPEWRMTPAVSAKRKGKWRTRRILSPLWKTGEDESSEESNDAMKPLYALKSQYQGMKAVEVVVDSAAVECVMARKDLDKLKGNTDEPLRQG